MKRYISEKRYYILEIRRLQRLVEKGKADQLDRSNLELHRLHLQNLLRNIEENGEIEEDES